MKRTTFSSLLLVALLVVACGGSASGPQQHPPAEWASYARATELDDEVLDLETLADGTIAAVGYERGIAGDRLDPSGNARAWIALLGKTGTVSVDRTFDTLEADSFEALVEDDNRLLIAGRTMGAIPDGTNYGQYDFVVASLDRTSQELSTILQHGTARPEHPRRIAIDPLGGVVIAGCTDIYVPTNYVERWENPFVARLARDGSMDWYQWRETDRPDRMYGLAADEDSFYLAGDGGLGSGNGAFVERRDAGGDVIWQRIISGAPIDSAASVAVSAGGVVLVAGTTSGVVGARSYGQQDGFVVALDRRDGTKLWAAQFGSSDGDLVTDMTLDEAGNIYISGETIGAVAPGAIARGAHDVFVVQIDATGDWVAAWQEGTSKDESARAIAVDAEGRILLGGYSEGAFGSANRGGRDGFIVEVELQRVQH